MVRSKNEARGMTSTRFTNQIIENQMLREGVVVTRGETMAEEEATIDPTGVALVVEVIEAAIEVLTAETMASDVELTGGEVKDVLAIATHLDTVNPEATKVMNRGLFEVEHQHGPRNPKSSRLICEH
jgi:hypothetical protein